MKTIFFTTEFVDAVRAALDEACSDGSCITYPKLAEKLNMSEDDLPVLREVIKAEFLGDADGDVEVVKGPYGGLGYRGMTRPSREKQEATVTVDPVLTEAVRVKLEELLTPNKKGVKAALLAGLLGRDDDTEIRAVVNSMPDFEMKRGIGICRRVQAVEKTG